MRMGQLTSNSQARLWKPEVHVLAGLDFPPRGEGDVETEKQAHRAGYGNKRPGVPPKSS